MKAKARILVVDDDPNLRKTLVDILHIKGYDTIAVGTGSEALQAMDQESANLALVDLMLPDMSGLEVIERIKAFSPLTEAIILTGYASMDTAIEATRKGAFSDLLKPYQMDDLLLNIRHGIERQQAREEILRLASHPRLNPNPVIEIDRAGNVTYVNPAAAKRFPSLEEPGRSHPLFAGLQALAAELRECGEPERVREIDVAEAVYEQHISYVEEVDLIRIHMLDISQRRQAEEALAAREREQAAVAELGTQALQGNSLQTLHQKAASRIAETLRLDHCLIFEQLGEQDALILRASTRRTPGADDKIRLDPGAGTWAGYTLTSDGPVVVADWSKEQRFAEVPLLQELHAVSGISLAIGPRQDPIGLLGIFASNPREFSADEIRFLQAMANVLAAAAQRKRADEEIHVLATTDDLTGIINRREFNRMLGTEIDRVRRYGLTSSLIMYDIDHFKRVNDVFGHDAGDRVLQQVTAIVRETSRSVDTVARWGGEEFMVLLPHAALADALAAAEKFRIAIADHRFGDIGQLTVSLGATALSQEDDLDSLTRRVDRALYMAKENGRNRVEALPGRSDMLASAASA